MRRVVLAVVLVVAALAAVVWPWPAPEVDWRTPAEGALAAKDCGAAVKILDAAAEAGSLAAYEKLRALVQDGPCVKYPGYDGADAIDAFLYFNRDRPVDEIYRLTSDDLGWGRHRLVSTSLELCADPYNGVRRIDYTQLTKVVPSGDGPVMALHRLRREICMALLEQLVERLIDAGDRSALRVAEIMTMSPPLHRRPQAAVLRARLILGMGFDTINSANAIGFVRGAVWIDLTNAAERKHLPAIRLLIDYIHEARYRVRDAGEAYYWILRLRRMGHEHPLARTIDAELSADQRKFQKQLEAYDWINAHPDQ